MTRTVSQSRSRTGTARKKQRYRPTTVSLWDIQNKYRTPDHYVDSGTEEHLEAGREANFEGVSESLPRHKRPGFSLCRCFEEVKRRDRYVDVIRVGTIIYY